MIGLDSFQRTCGCGAQLSYDRNRSDDSVWDQNPSGFASLDDLYRIGVGFPWIAQWAAQLQIGSRGNKYVKRSR
jgi:hypothetical protein